MQHSLGKKTSLKGLEIIFMEERKDSFLPYFIESTQIKSEKEILIKLEGIDNKELARKMTPADVWLKTRDFNKYASMSSPISLLGFMMVNEGQELGEVFEVIEQPQQLLCSIMLNGKEALIPLHEEVLDKIDKKKKRLYVTLPDGLLDIYN